MRVPLNDLSRAGAEAPALRDAFARVLGSGSFVLGQEVAAFEGEFAAFCGTRECIGVASGSDALELALRTLDIGPGDEIVTVANAAMYSTLAIRACGATPVYADVDDATLTLAASSLEAALSTRTRAVIVTHLYGRLADMRAVGRVVGAGIPIIEDCAQAHGARTSEARAGALGTLGCFSFYPTKNLGALGDGGAITTQDAALAERARALRQYGWRGKYRVGLDGGRNSRLDEVQAAFLRVRLPSLDARNERRRDIGRAYLERIRHGGIRMVGHSIGPDCVMHLAVVRCAARESLRAHLEGADVATDVHYPIPDHRQAVLRDRYANVSLPVTERACDEVLTLPCFPELTPAELDHVVEACNTWPG